MARGQAPGYSRIPVLYCLPVRRLAALALLAALAVVPAARADLRLGVQDDAWLSSPDPLAWQLAGDLAPRVIRYNIDWSSVAPTPPLDPNSPEDPAYDWHAPDGVVRRAAALGATVLVTIVQAPMWANSGRAARFAPDDPRVFGAFCKAVAHRYSGLGELPAVGEYTVWNEPNRGAYLQPQGRLGRTAPRLLARLAAACIPAIRSENPSARIAIGPLASRGAQQGLAPLAFLRQYALAGGPRFDALALNPYTEGARPLYRAQAALPKGAIDVRNLDRLEVYLRSQYGGTVPLWLTEYAWRTGGPGGVSADDQARFADQTVQLVRGRYPYAQMLIWYLLRDVSPTSYWQSGLVDSANQLKPAFAVWQRLALAGAGLPVGTARR